MPVRVVLVGTTHPGNIGAAARAMKNMGVTELALVSPRHFPHDEATARASGAEDLLQGAAVVETLEEAIADCVYVAGASARSRAISWPCMNPRDCAVKLIEESTRGPVAAVFGPGTDVLMAALPDARLSDVKGAGHLSPMTHAEVVNPLIVETLLGFG